MATKPRKSLGPRSRTDHGCPVENPVRVWADIRGFVRLHVDGDGVADRTPLRHVGDGSVSVSVVPCHGNDTFRRFRRRTPWLSRPSRPSQRLEPP